MSRPLPQQGRTNVCVCVRLRVFVCALDVLNVVYCFFEHGAGFRAGFVLFGSTRAQFQLQRTQPQLLFRRFATQTLCVAIWLKPMANIYHHQPCHFGVRARKGKIGSRKPCP